MERNYISCRYCTALDVPKLFDVFSQVEVPGLTIAVICRRFSNVTSLPVCAPWQRNLHARRAELSKEERRRTSKDATADIRPHDRYRLNRI
jgi:hypothetical protein